MSRMLHGANLFTPKGDIQFEIKGPCPSCGWDGTAFHPRKAEVPSPGLAGPVPRGPEPAAVTLDVAPEAIGTDQRSRRDPEIG
jgi:hypothetical protein